MVRSSDQGMEYLLSLDGQCVFFDNGSRAVFSVTSVATTDARPHGIKYKLVLLDANGERLVGFDNAHSVLEGSGPGRRRPLAHDHKHVGRKTVPYKFKDAYSLVADFWKEVDKHVNED